MLQIIWCTTFWVSDFIPLVMMCLESRTLVSSKWMSIFKSMWWAVTVPQSGSSVVFQSSAGKWREQSCFSSDLSWKCLWNDSSKPHCRSLHVYHWSLIMSRIRNLSVSQGVNVALDLNCKISSRNTSAMFKKPNESAAIISCSLNNVTSY